MDSSYPSENSARVIGRLQGIGTRLAGSFGLVLILCVAMATLGLLELRRITALEVQLDSLAQRKQAMEQWKGATSVNLARALAIAHSAYQADVVKAFDPLMKETTAHISVLQKGLEDRIDDEAERQAFAAVGDKRKAYVGIRARPCENSWRPRLRSALCLACRRPPVLTHSSRCYAIFQVRRPDTSVARHFA